MRILHVLNAMNVGGAETFLMNVHRNIDRRLLQFDYVVQAPGEGKYEPEIRELGGRVFRAEKYLLKNVVSYSGWWRDFLSGHAEYPIVHCHQGSVAPVCLRVANGAGRVSIAHSHNTHHITTFRSLLWKANSLPVRHIAKYFLACSSEAGIDRFGRRVVGSDRFHVVRNGICVERFRFREEARSATRATLGIPEGCTVVGHVGRFTAQKNHAFVIDVFEEVARRGADAVLLLVGAGEAEPEIRARVSGAGLEGRVRFAGEVRDVEDYYAAMDVFLFPSVYEGLGMAAVEAQTSGLPVVASDALPGIADIGVGLMRRLSLADPMGEWADAILSHAGKPRFRQGVQAARDAGYDIAQVARWLQDYYERLLRADGRPGDA